LFALLEQRTGIKSKEIREHGGNVAKFRRSGFFGGFMPGPMGPALFSGCYLRRDTGKGKFPRNMAPADCIRHIFAQHVST
jgi:hypothetical protein